MRITANKIISSYVNFRNELKWENILHHWFQICESSRIESILIYSIIIMLFHIVQFHLDLHFAFCIWKACSIFRMHKRRKISCIICNFASTIEIIVYVWPSEMMSSNNKAVDFYSFLFYLSRFFSQTSRHTREKTHCNRTS